MHKRITNNHIILISYDDLKDYYTYDKITITRDNIVSSYMLLPL